MEPTLMEAIEKLEADAKKATNSPDIVSRAANLWGRTQDPAIQARLGRVVGSQLG